MESFPQQKIMSFLLAFFMLVLAISTIYCVIRLQERILQVQNLQGQRTALQAQVKDWQEKCNKLPEDQQSGKGLMIKKMGVSLVSPAADAEITDSVLVQGYANVFEGTVNLRLKDAAGRILTADLAMACMGDWPCYFEKELKFTQPNTDTDAVLEVYTISAKDGSEQDLISIKLEIKGKSSTANDLTLARQALINYFTLLNEKNYTAAAEYYRGEMFYVEEWSKAEFLENRCIAGGHRCLKTRQVLEEKVISNNEFEFVVQFTNEQGNLFVSGPCCGATPEQDPPNSDFIYTVKKDAQGNFLVEQLPPYVA